MARQDPGWSRPTLLAALLLLGCQRAAGAEQEFQLVHLETTGLTTGVRPPSSASRPGSTNHPPVTMVEFSRDSNEDAIGALKALDDEVLLPNAASDRDHDGIVLVGVLDPSPHHTVAGPRTAESEPHQMFRLSHWYLRAPFLRRQSEPTPLDDAPPRLQRDTQLRGEDFARPIPGDLSRFVRRE